MYIIKNFYDIVAKMFFIIKKYVKLQRFFALIAYMKKKTLKYVFIATVFRNVVFMCFADKTKSFYTSQFILKYKKQ